MRHHLGRRATHQDPLDSGETCTPHKDQVKPIFFRPIDDIVGRHDTCLKYRFDLDPPLGEKDLCPLKCIPGLFLQFLLDPGLNVIADASFGGRTLVLSEPLIRVSIFLGAFSGMYFTVVLTTDETYRREFADDVGPEIRQVLAVRCAYHVERSTHPSSIGIEVTT